MEHEEETWEIEGHIKGPMPDQLSDIYAFIDKEAASAQLISSTNKECLYKTPSGNTFKMNLES